MIIFHIYYDTHISHQRTQKVSVTDLWLAAEMIFCPLLAQGSEAFVQATLYQPESEHQLEPQL